MKAVDWVWAQTRCSRSCASCPGWGQWVLEGRILAKVGPVRKPSGASAEGFESEGYTESDEVVIASEVFVKAVPMSCGAVSGKGKTGYGAC